MEDFRDACTTFPEALLTMTPEKIRLLLTQTRAAAVGLRAFGVQSVDGSAPCLLNVLAHSLYATVQLKPLRDSNGKSDALEEHYSLLIEFRDDAVQHAHVFKEALNIYAAHRSLYVLVVQDALTNLTTLLNAAFKRCFNCLTECDIWITSLISG